MNVTQKATEATKDSEPASTPASPPPAQMALFTFADGATLAIHIPRAVGVRGSDSLATKPGFILRRGGRIVNVGVLTQLLED